MPSVARWNRGKWNGDTWGNWQVGLLIGQHRFRLRIRWYDREDLFPTYYSLYVKQPTYQTTIDSYTTYQDLLDNVGGGVEADQDITCDLSGLTIKAGRDNSLSPVKAATMSFSLNDPDGNHDPRRPPVSGRTRTGSRVQLEVKPQDIGNWIPMFTGWVEEWQKDLTPNSDEVDVQCSDAFNMLARAAPVFTLVDIGLGSTTSEHLQYALDSVPWNDKWGDVDIYAGGYPCNAHRWDGDAEGLSYMQDIIFVEDGLLAIEPDGTLRAEKEGWRNSRTTILGVDLKPNATHAWETTPDDVVCPSELIAVDDDLDLLNRVTAWRDVAYDPLVGDPPAPPDLVKYTKQNEQSISYHGVAAKQWTLRCQQNSRSSEIAQLLIDRYSADRNDIGDVELDLMKRPEDALPVVSQWFGDTVVVRDIIGDTYLEQTHEVVGYSHRITPYRWEGTLLLDRKAT